MRYRLGTLSILLALLPPVMAAGWWMYRDCQVGGALAQEPGLPKNDAASNSRAGHVLDLALDKGREALA